MREAIGIGRRIARRARVVTDRDRRDAALHERRLAARRARRRDELASSCRKLGRDDGAAARRRQHVADALGEAGRRPPTAVAAVGRPGSAPAVRCPAPRSRRPASDRRAGAPAAAARRRRRRRRRRRTRTPACARSAGRRRPPPARPPSAVPSALLAAIGAGRHVVAVGEDDDRLVRLAPQRSLTMLLHRDRLAVAARSPERVHLRLAPRRR